MAEIAPNSTKHIVSAGSMKLVIVSLTLVTTGDTYTIEANAPVVDFWVQTHLGNSTGYNLDTTWTASSGAFTFYTDQALGLTSLFILMRT